jgi:hypothetical protein
MRTGFSGPMPCRILAHRLCVEGLCCRDTGLCHLVGARLARTRRVYGDPRPRRAIVERGICTSGLDRPFGRMGTGRRFGPWRADFHSTAFRFARRLRLPFAAGSSIAAWLATSHGELGDFGRQMGLPFYITLFESFAVNPSLIASRDRLGGILLGLPAMWLVFGYFHSAQPEVIASAED